MKVDFVGVDETVSADVLQECVKISGGVVDGNNIFEWNRGQSLLTANCEKIPTTRKL